MKQLIARLVCRWKGHRRGRLVESQQTGTIKIFECPRCLRRTEYKK